MESITPATPNLRAPPSRRVNRFPCKRLLSQRPLVEYVSSSASTESYYIPCELNKRHVPEQSKRHTRADAQRRQVRAKDLHTEHLLKSLLSCRIKARKAQKLSPAPSVRAPLLTPSTQQQQQRQAGNTGNSGHRSFAPYYRAHHPICRRIPREHRFRERSPYQVLQQHKSLGFLEDRTPILGIISIMRFWGGMLCVCVGRGETQCP